MKLIMQDYAPRDSRSVAAALRGMGDGRDVAYAQYLDSVIGSKPGLTTHEIINGYPGWASARHKARREAAPKTGNSTMAAVVIGLLCVAALLGTMVR